MTEEQRTMYSAVVSVRNTDVNLRWGISQLFFLINSAGFSLVVTRLAPDSRFYLLACIGGFVFGVLWFFIALRYQRLINYWNGKLGDLEETDTQPVGIFSDPFVRMRGRITTHLVLQVLIGLFALAWLIVAVAPLIWR